MDRRGLQWQLLLAACLPAYLRVPAGFLLGFRKNKKKIGQAITASRQRALVFVSSMKLLAEAWVHYPRCLFMGLQFVVV